MTAENRPEHIVAYSRRMVVDGRGVVQEGSFPLSDQPFASVAAKILDLMRESAKGLLESLEIAGAKIQGGVAKNPTPEYDDLMRQIREANEKIIKPKKP